MNERQSDFEWLRQFAREGDQGAFRELVRRHLDLVFATAMRKASDPASALQAQPTTLTVERYKAGGEWQMNYRLAQAGGEMSTSVTPWQPFPEAFRALFPGGWEELAQREGFDLPSEFKKHKGK